jgi:hypothetical protein
MWGIDSRLRELPLRMEQGEGLEGPRFRAGRELSASERESGYPAHSYQFRFTFQVFGARLSAESPDHSHGVYALLLPVRYYFCTMRHGDLMYP